MDLQRLQAQLDFVREVDKLKSVLRKTYLMDSSRNENSAEHSWHLALMAMVLAEHATEPIDLLHVMKMLLVHDIVEIDAGDTFCYDQAGNVDKEERETRAAERIFNLLPPDFASLVRELWDEFESRSTPEARFATSLDRLEPMLCNFENRGGSWTEHGINRRRVEDRNHVIAHGAPLLWEYASALLDEAEAEGFLKP